MTTLNRDFAAVDPSPIDIVEDIAERRCWDVDRLGDDQIAMAVEGAWATYSVSLAWFDPDETLRMVCTYEAHSPEARLPELYRAIEAANDRLWMGGFNYWKQQRLMAFRYGLTLRGSAGATFEQIDSIVRDSVDSCEKFFPAFHLVTAEGSTVESAMAAALLEASGHA